MSVLKAIEFSANAHLGYFRKGSKTPYITHPFEVAKILAASVDSETNEALICAGLLHDTVEDTETTLEIIRAEFGDEVAALVASDSEDKTLPWEKRKQNTIDFLGSEATYEMQLLACADKLSNLRSIKADYEKMGDEVWDIFVRGKDKQAWYYKGVMESLKPLSDSPMYQEFNQLVREIFD
ncbi:HD domain-containing protein [Acetobacterium fimetarium]|uniref:HD domain-containing protein n=1 Tax=Acetobacterium fimetarium TaxID=52691 RepID=A0ABR6WXA2_9FIRM|nr:HD domain-containing protein [Acetobacterium fimetarium]MBC3805185.1 HD domain-containing protein [Acetobacterium fimetarium]